MLVHTSVNPLCMEIHLEELLVEFQGLLLFSLQAGSFHGAEGGGVHLGHSGGVCGRWLRTVVGLGRQLRQRQLVRKHVVLQDSTRVHPQASNANGLS
jgi:hypothetical protein